MFVWYLCDVCVVFVLCMCGVYEVFVRGTWVVFMGSWCDVQVGLSRCCICVVIVRCLYDGGVFEWTS